MLESFIRPALPGDVPRGYALDSITPLTCTLFDPGNIGGFGGKCLCLTSAQRAEIPAPWYIFPSSVLKPAHRPTRRVTGLRNGGEESLDGIQQEYPLCFVGKSQ